MATTCLFCKIINKQIPSYIIYEDDTTIAFLDLNPLTKGHTLVIAKEHSNDFISSSDAILTNVALSTKKVATLLKEKLNPSGFNFLTNNGSTAGQTIMHYHWHIIPNYEYNSGLMLWEPKAALNIQLELLCKTLTTT